jgi:predicted nucleotidyltransferase
MIISQSLLDEYTSQIKGLFGMNLVSVVLYGSSVTGEYHPKRSDLNILIVLGDASLSELRKARDVFHAWHKKHKVVPLVMDEAYIKTSLDTFPIEFLNMRAQYRVLYGRDVLAGLRFDKKWVRLQAERELKGKLLRLQQVYLEVRKADKELAQVIYDSLNTFTAIFRALLFLKDQEHAASKQEVLSAVCREFGLEEGVFTDLWRVRNGELELKGRELEHLFEQYFQEIKKLHEAVNGWDVV